MKRLLLIGVLTLLIALIASAPVLASSHDGDAPPIETCPPSFDHVHQVDCDGQHSDGAHAAHKHVGNDKDQNGDGWVCVKHTGKDDKIHVHADNNYRRGQQ